MLFRYTRWKRMARKAIAGGKTTECTLCDDPIVPSDFVGITTDEKYIHAGSHYTLKDKSAICVSGATGSGYWDGENIVSIGESVAAKAMRTGEVQIGNY